MGNDTSPNNMTPGLGRKAQAGRLGTFIGVYTPTVLTILGVIMYLRFGWVLGQVGLAQCLVIVVLANITYHPPRIITLFMILKLTN